MLKPIRKLNSRLRSHMTSDQKRYARLWLGQGPTGILPNIRCVHGNITFRVLSWLVIKVDFWLRHR